MHYETKVEPLDGKLPKVTYTWDTETDILSVACKGGSKATGLNGTVDLQGDDGSFVVMDVSGGVLRGLDVVSAACRSGAAGIQLVVKSLRNTGRLIPA